MAEIFGYPIMGGGGSDLNFKVIAVASESALPSTAAENTIAVITTTPISEWEMSAVTSPTWSAPEGFVYITTRASYLGDGIAFNAIKKNGLWVYPTGCQQYVSGAWVQKTAKTYQNGAWVEWTTYLYNRGAINTDVTGGLTTVGYTINSVPLVAPKFEGNRIVLEGAANVMFLTGTANAIDLSPYSQLKIEANVVSTYQNYPAFSCRISASKDAENNLLATVSNTTLGEQTVTLDVSNINQPAYIVLAGGGVTEYLSYIYTWALI